MSHALRASTASRLRALVAAALPLLGASCIPYAVGTTAQPVPRGEMDRSNVTYFVPAGIERRADSASASYLGLDSEVRFGLGDGMDVGLRFPGLAGAVVNVKRRLGPSGDAARAATAVMGGVGLVNGGSHALLEATVIRSGRERETATPYGGARAMHVVPLDDTAVSDSPTLGLFGGVRLGAGRRGFSPELGIYYDRSALGLRSSRVIVVPSVTLHARRGASRLLPF